MIEPKMMTDEEFKRAVENRYAVVTQEEKNEVLADALYWRNLAAKRKIYLPLRCTCIDCQAVVKPSI